MNTDGFMLALAIYREARGEPMEAKIYIHTADIGAFHFYKKRRSVDRL